MSIGIPDDPACPKCDTDPVLRTCSVCNVTARIIDCGHKDQPRPISADDGTFYCEDCWPTQLAGCIPA